MTLGCGYSPLKARGKRPFPMWIDALLRDTLELSADEFGAYHMILYAMWKRETCSISSDPKRLAQIARVSTRLWNSRVGPALMDFFEEKDGTITSKKLAIEARSVEKWCTSQHIKKCDHCKKSGAYALPQDTLDGDQVNGEKSRNPLKNNNPQLTGDITLDASPVETPEQPTQYSNSKGSGGSARASNPDLTEREMVLGAIGADPISGLTSPNGKCIGRMVDLQELQKWKSDLGLDLEEIIAVITEVMADKKDGQIPSTFTYFTQPMQRYAAAKRKPPLIPIDGGQNDNRGKGQKSIRTNDPARQAHNQLIAGFEWAVSKNER